LSSYPDFDPIRFCKFSPDSHKLVIHDFVSPLLSSPLSPTRQHRAHQPPFIITRTHARTRTFTRAHARMHSLTHAHALSTYARTRPQFVRLITCRPRHSHVTSTTTSGSSTSLQRHTNPQTPRPRDSADSRRERVPARSGCSIRRLEFRQAQLLLRAQFSLAAFAEPGKTNFLRPPRRQRQQLE
jgi:hypothetical protein